MLTLSFLGNINQPTKFTKKTDTKFTSSKQIIYANSNTMAGYHKSDK